MKEHIVTQSELRARAQGISPAAEVGQSLPRSPSSGKNPAGTMSRAPIPMEDGKPLYVDERTGRALHEKPEEMTHLHGNALVPKTHPRIAFRGKLDSLMGEILLAQAEAKEAGEPVLVEHLQEVLDFARAILGAEVKEEALPEIRMEGMDTAKLRYASHHIKETAGIDHPIPSHRMGYLAMRLNALRTIVRETELSAALAFTDASGKCSRKDIVEGLNRLSSYIYILFCREAAKTSSRGEKQASAEAVRKEPILVEVSARHIHLSEEDLQILFGAGFALTRKKDLSQPGQYQSGERVKVAGPKGEFPKVAILGPVRSETQLEISLSDARVLGIEVPVNLSGNLAGAAEVTITGPAGSVVRACAIAAKEHVHMPGKLASSYGVRDGDHVRVCVHTDRPTTLEDVIVRVSDDFSLAMHIDTDQANAAHVAGTAEGYLL